MRWRIPLGAAAATAMAVLATVPTLAQDIPLQPYPRSAAAPTGDNRLPAYLDDDEHLIVVLDHRGDVTSLEDQFTLKLRGSGDYAFTMTRPALSVGSRGAGAPPGFDNGHVTFMGFITGSDILTASAKLAAGAYQPPLTLKPHYIVDGAEVSPELAAARKGDEEIRYEVANLTARSITVSRATPTATAGRRSLLQALTSLRGAASTFTPEIDLQAVYPLPSTIPAEAGRKEAATTYVPFATAFTVRVVSGDGAVTGTGPGQMTTTGAGEVAWTGALPDALPATGTQSFSVRFRHNGGPLPTARFVAAPAPLPGALLSAPGGKAWTSSFAGADVKELAVRAQVAAASLARVSELPMPLGRPGPGPQRVTYELLLAPPPAVSSPPPPAQPWHPSPFGLVVALAGVAALSGALAWLWARH